MWSFYFRTHGRYRNFDHVVRGARAVTPRSITTSLNVH